MSEESNGKFGHREMAELYLDDAELHLDYAREDLGKQDGLRLALINLGVAKYNIELLEYVIRRIQNEGEAK